MSIASEFKDFINRGSVVDLAVGVVIGAAFGKIVTSFTNDILMPPIGMIMGKVDFTNLFLDISGKGPFATLADAKKVAAATINYGIFLNAILDFLIVAFAIFLLVKQVNRMKKPAPAAAPTTKDCPQCAMAIPIAAKRCPQCTSQLAAAAS